MTEFHPINCPNFICVQPHICSKCEHCIWAAVDTTTRNEIVWKPSEAFPGIANAEYREFKLKLYPVGYAEWQVDVNNEVLHQASGHDNVEIITSMVKAVLDKSKDENIPIPDVKLPPVRVIVTEVPWR